MLRELWQIRQAWRNRTVPVTLTATVPVPEPARPQMPAAA
jgi:hypothetical protein